MLPPCPPKPDSAAEKHGVFEAALRRWSAWAMTEERATQGASFRLSTTDSEGS